MQKFKVNDVVDSKDRVETNGRTDFSLSVRTNGGDCISCHINAVGKNPFFLRGQMSGYRLQLSAVVLARREKLQGPIDRRQVSIFSPHACVPYLSRREFESRAIVAHCTPVVDCNAAARDVRAT